MAQPGARSACGVLACAAVAAAILWNVEQAQARRPSLRTDDSKERSGEVAQNSRAQSEAAGRSSDSDKKFAVDAFSPRGPAPPGAVISVTFTTDVVTSEALDEGKLPESVFSFEPSIEGALQWESARQVRFVPARPLLNGTEYIARINPLLKDANGTRLGKQPEYRFQTPALTLTSAVQREFTPDRKAVIALRFSDKVEPRELQKHLSFAVGEDELRWRPQSDVAAQDISIVTDPVSTESVKLTLEPGLRGVSGPLGLRSRVERKVKLEFRMVATEIRAQWRQGEPELVVKFSSHPGTADAEKFVSVEPPVKVHFASGYQSELIIRGPFEAEKRYTVKIKPGLQGYSGKVMVEPATLAVWLPKVTPFLDLPEGGGGYLGTQGRMKLRVRTAGVNKLTVAARRVFDNNLVFHTLYERGTYGVSTLGKKIAEKSYDVQADLSKPHLTEIDLKELLGPGAAGIYSFAVTGDMPSKGMVMDGDWSRDYESFQRSELQGSVKVNLSNIGIVTKEGATEVLVFTAALDTARPMAGVKVSLFSQRNQLMGEAITDASGMALIKDLAADNKDARPAVLVAQNAANNEISVLNMREALSGLEQFDSSGRRFLRDGYEVFLTPERGAYRPGETAHLSGFIRGRDATVPPSAFPLEVVLKRPDGKKMTPEIKTPTASGLLNFDVTIPDYAPTGYYTVDVRLPGSSDDETEEYGDEYDY